jgi:septum formation protein
MSPASLHRIVLASGSPRRRDLATAAGWDVLVMPPPEEAEARAATRSPGETLEDYVIRLARVKGQATVGHGATGLVLACDTVSEVEGVALGKATDRDDARRMLELLSGRKHRVLTGVWLCRTETDTVLEAVEESLLFMHPLDRPFLDWYLDTGMWRGKAGGCGFQDERLPLELVAGSESNVVGMPIERIETMLAALTPRDPLGR